MKAICLNLILHQPYKFRKYCFLNIGRNHHYCDDYTNEGSIRNAAAKSFLPTNKLLLELIKKHKENFKVSITITGLALEQMQKYSPEVIDSFKELAKTNCVEFIATPYSYSLSSVKYPCYFETDVEKQVELIYSLFGKKTEVLFNSELAYSNDIAKQAHRMGFKAMFTEESKQDLAGQSPNHLYESEGQVAMKLFVRNTALCNKITFNFSNHPFKAEDYAREVTANPNNELVTLCLEYDVFGGFHNQNSGIFDFLRALPNEIISNGYKFSTPSEILKKLKPKNTIDSPHPTAWSNEDRNLTPYLGNDLQNSASDKLNEFAERMLRITDHNLNQKWNNIQACNHLYLMGQGFYNPLSPLLAPHGYNNPYEAFINYMNILSDFEYQLDTFAPTTEALPEEFDTLHNMIIEKDIEIDKQKKEINRLRKRLENTKN